MCGIAGLVGNPDRALLERMCDRIIHRGPDEDGFFMDGIAGLSMRRLSIIDLAGGTQPISNETGDVHVVFNGEIYNFESLRASLQSRGHVFKTNSDTETIVHAYEEYGLDFPKHLRGMFGIAVWDQKIQQLCLVRDRLGEKPLYISGDERRLVFGSEVKAMLPALSNLSVNRQSVADFFSQGYLFAPDTAYQQIGKLAPGEMLVWQPGKITRSRYWDLLYPADKIPYAEAKPRIADSLDEAVKLCLKSDVEVGAFLSGGLDSSILTALMRKHEAKVKTFTIGYQGEAEGFNELAYAKVVADALGTEHHELLLDANSSIDLLPDILWHYDEPHGEPTSVMVYQLCKFVAGHLKVAVGGTGGDELFYGYPKHKAIRFLRSYSKLPMFLRKDVLARMASFIPVNTKGGRLGKRVKRFLSGAAVDDPAMAYLFWTRLIEPAVHRGLLSDSTIEAIDDVAGERKLIELLGDPSEDVFDRVTRVDLTGYLPEYQLTYMDRMSMAHSLEVRSPLVDYRLAELVAGVETDARLHKTTTKYVLKEIALDYLPADIVHRKKVGFDSPIGQWFKTELRPFLDSFLSEAQVNETGFLSGAGVANMMSDHYAGKADYSLQLWSVLAFEAWHRMYMEGRFDLSSPPPLAELRGARR
ncbi:MAG: asparagine synthase (glutamine-hydrolyzing) [Pseudomonadaceae bacterium]|nr:asparagine synthase (glutamine-hydrolyzing) [Pseudomonadaceae bacterium]